MINETLLQRLEFQKVMEYHRKYLNTENGLVLLLNSFPLSNLEQIKKEGKFVDEAKEVLINNEIPPIYHLPILDEVISKTNIEGSRLLVEQIYSILKLLEISRNLIVFFKNKDDCEFLKSSFEDKLYSNKNLENEIRSIFTETGEINDNASKKLREIRNEIREKNFTLQKVINRILKQLKENSYVQGDYVTLNEGRVVLPVKAEHKRHVKGFIHSESATGQTVYIEPAETLDLNNEILSLSFAEKREIDRILEVITNKLSEVSHELKSVLYVIAKLDLIFAKAKYSLDINGSFPTIDNNKSFELINARHPILLKKFGIDKTIPLNFKIKDNIVTLITGPNAGGKTVVLKTLGLNLLLVYSGFHIPIHPDSNFHIFDDIFIDIGDEQSIESSLSTFSSHLSNYKYILDYATNNSFVLIDEIGTGTDPEEGGAIAASILNILKQRGTKTLATTHLGKLKIMANDTEGFQNASMEYDLINLVPTYKFRQGIPGSSYAFEVAERIGFDKNFISQSKIYLDSDKINVEKFLVELEEKTINLNNKLKQAEIENTKLKGLTQLYQQKITQLDKEKKEIINSAKTEATLILKNVNSQIEKTIKNIKESSANNLIIKKEKQEIERLKINLKISKEEVKEIELNFEIGDYVRIKNTDAIGIIDSILDEKNLMVLIGSIKMKVKNTDIELSSKSALKNELKNNLKITANYANYTLDIRGERTGEIANKLIKFLDNSFTSGLERVEILHGKGTGALKKVVWDILKEHDCVNKYYYASIESGGEGITIVELK
ncbi:MAG TPA: endonuclease MutS2 [Melioribacteraceae bacterium]|nr:endonuclease MutS2 [Melioribacteraceae bacterium]